MPEFIRRGTDATIIRHSAKNGDYSLPARVYEMLPPMAMPEYEVAVILRHKPPRSPSWRYTYIVPGSYVYYTIETDGQEIYDSRTEVGCDMELFEQLSHLMEKSGYSETWGYDQPYDDWDFDELVLLFDQQEPKRTPNRRRRKRSRQEPSEIVDLAALRAKRQE